MDNSDSVINDMIKDVAAGGAIRHLYDLGYDVEMIRERLDFPMDREDIEDVVSRYEERLASGDGGYRIVKKQGKYGKITYIKEPRESAHKE